LTPCGLQHLAVLRRDDEMSVLLLQVPAPPPSRFPPLPFHSMSHYSFLMPASFVNSKPQSGADAFIADRDGQNAVSLATKRQRTALFGSMDR
jgi:hypothetical protein